jgi:hypothetical protein
MRNRKLSLKRESLSDLTTRELGSVAGGQQDLTHLTCGLCLTEAWSYADCPTVPVNGCVDAVTSAIAGPRTIPNCMTT